MKRHVFQIIGLIWLVSFAVISLLLFPELTRSIFAYLALMMVPFILHLSMLSLVPKFYLKYLRRIKSWIFWWRPQQNTGSAKAETLSTTVQTPKKLKVPPTSTTQVGQTAPSPTIHPPAVIKKQPSGEKRHPVGVLPVVQSHYEAIDIPTSALQNLTEVGGGGEAVVYNMGNGEACKIFREPDDPYYKGSDMDAERDHAKQRLNAYPCKLPQFPVWLGSRVIAPQAIVVRAKAKYPIVGYTMKFVSNATPLTKFANPKWKRTNKITTVQIARIFLDLYDTVQEMHACGMLIGDFKPANILVQKNKAYIVDAESASFGEYPCRTFTETYVDPRICNQKLDYLVLDAPYDRQADWYSFVVMLFKVLTNLGPYDGVCTPKKGEKPIAPAERPLKRISVFNERVAVPNFTDSISSLPQPLQDLFYQVFEVGVRGRPDRKIIESLIPEGEVWEFIPHKNTCWSAHEIDNSNAVTISEAVLKAKKTPLGELFAFNLVGRDLYTLNNDNGIFRREDGKVVFQGDIDGFNFFDVGTGFTIIGKDLENSDKQTETFDGPFYVIPDSTQAQVINHVDPAYDGKPNVVVQRDTVFWVFHGMLYSLLAGKNEKRSLIRFSGNVKIFSGNNFGLAFTTIDEEMADIYCFKRNSIDRLITLPPIMGKIQDIHCEFSQKAAWMFVVAEWNQVKTEYVMVFDKNCKLLAMGQLPYGEAPWLMNDAFTVPQDDKIEGKKTKFLPKLVCFHDGKITTYTTADQKIRKESEGLCDVSRFSGVVYLREELRGLLTKTTEQNVIANDATEEVSQETKDDVSSDIVEEPTVSPRTSTLVGNGTTHLGTSPGVIEENPSSDNSLN